MLIQPLHQLRWAHSAGLAGHFLAVFHHHERWNTADHKMLSQVRFSFGAYLHKARLAGILLCNLLKNGRKLLAWAAPAGPKIHHQRQVTIAMYPKFVGRYFKGFARKQGRLTSPTFGFTTRFVSSHTVLFMARRAGRNKLIRHKYT